MKLLVPLQRWGQIAFLSGTDSCVMDSTPTLKALVKTMNDLSVGSSCLPLEADFTSTGLK